MLLPVTWICLFILLYCLVSWYSCNFNLSKILAIWKEFLTSLSASDDWPNKRPWISTGNRPSAGNLKIGSVCIVYFVI